MALKVLLIGGTGQLGSELRRSQQDRWQLMVPDRDQIDMSRPDDAVAAIAAFRPDWVVNTAAFHVVDRCEAQFADALAINAVAVSRLAKACAETGARFCTISTDYAFDGITRRPYREDDPASPIQCYGISKVAGERAAIAAHAGGALVVRSCGLYGHAESRQKGGNFVTNRLAEAQGRNSITVGADLVCTPTSAADLAAALVTLVEQDAAGLYHITNSGECNWAEFTAAAFALAKVECSVLPVDRQGHYAPARRPAYSVLNGEKAASAGVALRPWQDALADYVAGLGGT